VIIGIYDLNGRLMHEYQPANLVPGLNRWNSNMKAGKFNAGVYVAGVKVNGMITETFKLVKMKH
jgi:hypothetical protein